MIDKNGTGTVSFNEILEARHDAKSNGAAAAGVQHDALGCRLLSRKEIAHVLIRHLLVLQTMMKV